MEDVKGKEVAAFLDCEVAAAAALGEGVTLEVVGGKGEALVFGCIMSLSELHSIVIVSAKMIHPSSTEITVLNRAAPMPINTAVARTNLSGRHQESSPIPISAAI